MPPNSTSIPLHRSEHARSADRHFDAAAALHQSGRFADAERLYRTVLTLDARHFGALHNLGYMRLQQGQREEAAQFVRSALKVRPKSAPAHNTLGLALHTLGRFRDATACFEMALALNPDYAEAHNNLGAALHLLGRYARAIACYGKALSLRPDYAEAHGNLGNSLLVIGRLEEARSSFETAVAFEPRRASFYLSLSGTKRFSAGDPYLAAMEALAGELDRLPESERMHLHFALAKCLADTGEQARSFEHMLAGNAIKRRQVAYDEEATLRRFERARQAFASDTRATAVSPPGPIFVIGMMRSGTTLIEQILASHPKVFGAGERADFQRAVDAIMPGYEDASGALSAAQLRRVGARYLGSMGALSPSSERMVDKMPTNFLFAGLIAQALPNARIIHARRDPIDTCVSCFATLFRGELPFTYDLSELGRYYRAYETLMEHWRAVLPPGTMIEVQYEDLVADLESEARRMLAHCGLDWDPACLAFHQTERPVLTASSVQVRQPLYRTSIGRWRAYGDRLSPLFKALGRDVR